MISTLAAPNGHSLAYQQHKAGEGRPSVMFLGGFKSDMTGTKAAALHRFCEEKQYNFTRFDYFGHGQSSGTFEEGTIGRWRDDAVAVFDGITSGKQVLVGSSMGGWLMMLVALARSERVAGLVGIASAPDFTERLIWELMTPTMRKTLARDGVYDLASDYSDTPYPISMELIRDGRDYLLLNDKINIQCPVRLLHGMKDDDVPYQLSVELAEQLESDNVRLTLVKEADHRMSSESDIALLCQTVEEILAISPNKD